MDTASLIAQRGAKDEFLVSDPHSPLDHHDQHGFTGLRYYEPNPDLAFALPVKYGGGEAVRLQTSDGQERLYTAAASVEFEVGGEPTTLTLYSTGHPGFFVPFRDATSGSGTYGAGRYLDIEAPVGGVVEIDFNLAYNPYCAYNEAYSCPLPPIVNWLEVPIEAGEMDYVK